MMQQHHYKIQSHNGDYLIGARGATMTVPDPWPVQKEVVEPMTTRMSRWRHSHLLIMLVVLATLMLLLALVSGTVLYFHYLPYRRRPTIPDKPCEKMYCAYGSKCLVDEITQQAYCRCQESCTDVFTPICGSNGVTYTNDCQMKVASCTMQQRIYVDHHGQCGERDPCKEKECHFGAQCKPSLDGKSSECVCPEKCPSYGNNRSSRPVCGTDGKDYSNVCELKKVSCRDMRPLDVRFSGRCDPCEGVECPNSQVCQLDENRNAICRCNAICSDDAKPVCGSDGRTYSNECTLRVEACKTRKSIRVVYGGECSSGKNPCENQQCGPLEECNINKLGIVSCQCPPTCESIMRPVCGSDGQTYPNECELQRQACLHKRMATVSYLGQCADMGPCHNYRCSYFAICVLKNNHPNCECPTCTDEYEPVCGTDGISYLNECKLKRESCEKHKEIATAYPGSCDKCEKKKCEHYAVCELNNGHPSCVCPQQCVKIESKICGNDGITYQNECELRVSACTKKQYIVVASKGPCDLCINVHCKYGARCEDGKCVCPTECPEKYEPVCSSDGSTYSNDCEMKRASCVQTQELSVLFYGECEDVGGSGAKAKTAESGSGTMACEEEPCRFGGICDYDSEGLPQCVCPFECPAVREPVCGSDGQFYDSDCKMKQQACETQKKIVIAGKNRCQKRVEIACDGETPLINPVTGTDYFCGDGPESKQCPPSSYCHKTAEFAKCCREVVLIKSCADSLHGCCPDGKTAAQGPDQAGCPSQCHCNRLGSYSLTCDPASQQCPCKPGVGGLRCDRCEPGFWGLHKISDGSSGCSPCACDQYGSVRDDCEQMTGRCVCKHGIQGMKCNICPVGTVLGPDGCMDASIAKAVSGSCEQLECFYGATCKEKLGEAQCICDFKCTSEEREKKAPEDSTVCGSDANSYGSECQLQLFSCRYQKPIEMISEGPCSKVNFTTTPLSQSTTAVPLRRSTEDKTFGPTDSKQARDVTQNPLENLLYTEEPVLKVTHPPKENVIGIPKFLGKSFLELRKLEAYSGFNVELEVSSSMSDGLILYNGQTATGNGDFVSISLKDDFVEYRFDLGSGPVVLRSSQKLERGKFHRISVMRHGRNAMLSIDDKDKVTGQSSGPRNSLDLGENLYIGFVPGSVEQIFENVGTHIGFHGCIRYFKIGYRFVDLQFPGPEIINGKDIQQCSDDSCTSMPCQNGASCAVTGDNNYFCLCAPNFTGRHCEVQLEPCASSPCSFGSTCVSLLHNKFTCICPAGSSGELCDQVSAMDDASLTLDFSGRSYLEFRSLNNVAHSLAIELWFLTRSLNGLLLFNGQKPSGKGDFVALTLLNGFVHFAYNLGSGTANISMVEELRSLEPVSLGTWHSVKVSRIKRKGSLQVDSGSIVTGESKASLSELNLGQPFYLGGIPDYQSIKNILAIESGLDGAIQRVIVNEQVWDDLMAVSTNQHNIERFQGSPCFFETCKNGGRCIPLLEDYRCQCLENFIGRHCNETVAMEVNDLALDQPVAFDGSTFMQFSGSSKIDRLRRRKENHFVITFRTTEANGLIAWTIKGNSIHGDYFALAVVNGYLHLSFNLGKQTEQLVMKSEHRVNDNLWHTVIAKRTKRLAHLIVDNSLPITGVSEAGATELNTDGILWIGGSTTVPSGFPSAYYYGFSGCISTVIVDGESLHLSSGYSKYCQPS